MLRRDNATAAYRKVTRKRQVWVEPLFGEATDWHGLRRFRLRELDNVNIEGLLIAAGQYLTRSLGTAGWVRRDASCGCPVALPGPGRVLAANRRRSTTEPEIRLVPAADREITGEGAATGAFFNRRLPSPTRRTVIM